MGKKGYAEIKAKESYDFWMKQGTMQAFDFTKARARLFGAEGHPETKITFFRCRRPKKRQKKN
jgi:hypothetical protein